MSTRQSRLAYDRGARQRPTRRSIGKSAAGIGAALQLPSGVRAGGNDVAVRDPIRVRSGTGDSAPLTNNAASKTGSGNTGDQAPRIDVGNNALDGPLPTDFKTSLPTRH